MRAAKRLSLNGPEIMILIAAEMFDSGGNLTDKFTEAR